MVYIHPDQVHRIGGFEDATVNYWVIDSENLYDEQRKLLEDLSPVNPIQLDEESFPIISDAISLCLKILGRGDEKLYHTLVKDSCNTLVGLDAAQYPKGVKTIDALSRFELLPKLLRSLWNITLLVPKSPLLMQHRSIFLPTILTNVSRTLPDKPFPGISKTVSYWKPNACCTTLINPLKRLQRTLGMTITLISLGYSARSQV